MALIRFCEVNHDVSSIAFFNIIIINEETTKIYSALKKTTCNIQNEYTSIKFIILYVKVIIYTKQLWSI